VTGFPAGYVRSMLGPRDEVLDQILRRSLAAQMPTIQIDDNAGRLLQLLTMVHAPRLVIEIGTLFGYSTIYIARGLPPGGRIITLEVDPIAAGLARQNVDAAGVGDLVDIVVGDAADYLTTAEPESVGMLFIDADKKSYPTYLKLAFPLLEAGGLMIADDAFASGDFAGEAEQGEAGDREIKGICGYARAVGRSPRLFSAFAGTEHGMLISYKQKAGIS